MLSWRITMNDFEPIMDDSSQAATQVLDQEEYAPEPNPPAPPVRQNAVAGQYYYHMILAQERAIREAAEHIRLAEAEAPSTPDHLLRFSAARHD